MKSKKEIQLSVIKGDKLFNEYTPFVINIIIPDSKKLQKHSNADIICVIDISGSMSGSKINLVKESLKILIKLMDKNDRIALILFNDEAKEEFNLTFCANEKKPELNIKIDTIEAGGGTNILSGLKMAIDLLINDKEKTKNNRASSILLLSDGCDNNLNDFELGQELKNLTKGKGLDFTLSTFGYGNDHDPKTMKKLASIRDGSFFFVDNLDKVVEFFGIALGTCVSVISNKASLVVELLNKKCKIIKVFGKEYFFNHEIKSNFFTTTFLNFASGKDFTYVLEFEICLKNVKIGEDLLLVDFIYQDKDYNFCKISKKYKYTLTDINHEKANEEYIRCQVYSVIDESLKLKENYNNDKAEKILNDMKNWLIENNKKYSKKKLFLNDINKALDYYKNKKEFKNEEKADIINNIFENTTKRESSLKRLYYNSSSDHYSATSRRILLNERERKEITIINDKKKKCIIF